MKKSIVALVIIAVTLLLFSTQSGRAETITADVAVVGAGAAGLSAALTAAEQGAKVIVFEKQAYFTGSSNFFEGTFAVESAMQRRDYIGYTRDEAFRNIMENSHWRANPRLVRAFVDESAASIEWLQKQGVEFLGAATNMPDSARTYHLVKGFGAAIVKALAEKAKAKGVDIRMSTPVTKLIKEGNRVIGVVAGKDGKTIEVKVKAVVIATGGYGNNKEWLKKYTGLDMGVNAYPEAQVGKMGDGIRMAWEAGAAEEGIDLLLGFRLGPRGPGVEGLGALMCASAQPHLWVNQQGLRFCDEAVNFNDSFQGNITVKLKEGYSYTIFDERIKQEMVERGIDRNISSKNWPGTRLVKFDDELNNLLAKGNKDVVVAGSLEELSGRLGIKPEVLKTTVDEYNDYCEKGHDALFAKDRKYLKPIKGPKFYAIKAYTVFLGTLGGIRINEKMEAVNREGKAIPGLYAAGADAGGMYGDTYSMAGSTGAASAFAVTSGRIAGKNAVAYGKKR